MVFKRNNSELFTLIPYSASQGPVGAVITQVTHDSRSVQENTLYVALPGEHFDGHDFIRQAISEGAHTIIHQNPLDYYDPEILYLQVSSSRQALSKVSNWFFGTEANKVQIIGITGTDGKSSTCHFIYELLKTVGIKASLLSTVSYDDGSGLRKNPTRMTTPEAPDIHRFLACSQKNGVRFAILETSSHALSSKTLRLADVQFDMAITTSLTSDHLDFHENVASYIDDKLSLFKRLKKDRGIAIAHRDGNHYRKITLLCRNLISYSLEDDSADLLISLENSDSTLHIQSDHFGLDSHISAPFKQPFFLLDVAAALSAVLSIEDANRKEVIEAVTDLQLITGRGKEYRRYGRLIIFDYAHTPDSFRKLFSYYHLTNPDHTSIIVFGAAGSRDHSKRSLMGSIAAEYGRLLIITSEDPRNEAPQDIYEEILSKMNDSQKEHCLSIPDRSQAIEMAFEASNDGDMIFFLGKGHESSIQIDGQNIIWDEQKLIEEHLGNLQEELV